MAVSLPQPVQGVQLVDPLDRAVQAMKLKDFSSLSESRAAEAEKLRMAGEDRQVLAGLIRDNTTPDGQVNHNAVVAGLATQGRGYAVPKYQEDLSQNNERDSKTQKQQFDIAIGKLNAVNGAVSSLLSRGDSLTHDDAINTIVDLAQNNIIDRKQAANFVRSLPPDIAGLRQLLTQKGLETMDAKERMKMLTPDNKVMDMGGHQSVGTVNQLTGQYTEVKQMPKTNSPDSILTNETSRDNNIRTNNTSRANAKLTNDRGNVVVLQTPTGYQILNKADLAKGAGPTSLPVTDANTGEPVVPKDNIAFKDSVRRSALMGQIMQARSLIPKATSSGVGALLDKAGNAIGVSSETADAASELDTVGAWMTSNTPRFEGPQSDADRSYYQQMAADVADRTKPASQRLAALNRLEALLQDAEKRGHVKWVDAGGATSPRGAGGRPPLAPATPTATPSPAGGGGARPPLSAFQKP